MCNCFAPVSTFIAAVALAWSWENFKRQIGTFFLKKELFATNYVQILVVS